MANMHLTGEDSPVEISIDSFLANLPELLGSMMRDTRRVLAIADFNDFRYVQFWCENQHLIGEVISNLYIPEPALTSEQELALFEAGWSPPEDRTNPNWYFEIERFEDLPKMVAMTQHAVVEILQQGKSPELMTVSLKTFDNGEPGEISMSEARRVTRRNYDPDDDVC
jgi:hypothetical protein